eukprot:GEZU01015956.1.p1 GENE.GEZU01015956.1~~GEZU01015956.1.p1  ORF type:complete len:110 (+),score=8.69 GEZU01015956.1:74-403(+)
MYFCPIDGNLLLVENSADKTIRFWCQTCPYICHVSTKLTHKVRMKTKKVDDVLGGEEAWKNVDKTQVKCINPKCEGEEAYYFQVQIRSADEPSSTFYKCVKCAVQWREG